MDFIHAGVCSDHNVFVSSSIGVHSTSWCWWKKHVHSDTGHCSHFLSDVYWIPTIQLWRYFYKRHYKGYSKKIGIFNWLWLPSLTTSISWYKILRKRSLESIDKYSHLLSIKRLCQSVNDFSSKGEDMLTSWSSSSVSPSTNDTSSVPYTTTISWIYFTIICPFSPGVPLSTAFMLMSLGAMTILSFIMCAIITTYYGDLTG